MSTDDPVIRELREKISDTDRAIVEAINTRLKHVAQLKQYKELRGIEFVDHAREESMLQHLAQANPGPLSTEGLTELYTKILDLTKREVARGDTT